MNPEEPAIVDQSAGLNPRPNSPSPVPRPPSRAPLSISPATARWERIHAFVAARRSLLAQQGTIVASWRTYRGRQLGPYYRLAYREAGRQCSLYLGCALDLVRQVQQTLAEFQRALRERQVYRRLRSAALEALRASKARLRQQLAVIGIHLKGFELRGIRAAFARRFSPLAGSVATNLWAGERPPPFVPPVPPSLRKWFWRTA